MNQGDLGRRPPTHVPAIMNAGNLRTLSEQLLADADSLEGSSPDQAARVRLAARFCRHALKVGWVSKTAVCIS
jgi:hypothetical protein